MKRFETLMVAWQQSCGSCLDPHYPPIAHGQTPKYIVSRLRHLSYIVARGRCEEKVERELFILFRSSRPNSTLGYWL